MGHGDIVKYNNKRYIVLKQEGSMLFLLDYFFNTDWADIEDCQKLGSSDAIFKAMYELSTI